MKHGEVRGRLGSYLEGDLPLQQRALVDAHLDACPNCAQELKELRGAIGLLRALPEVAPPAGFASSVIARIQAGEAEPTLWVRLLDGLDLMLHSRPLALALAAGAAAVALWAPGWLGEQRYFAPRPALALSPSDVSAQALANRVAPLDRWLAQTPFVHRPVGASAPEEEAEAEMATPLPPVGPELVVLEPPVDEILRDPSGFLDALSLLPGVDRDEEVSALVEEANREGRTAEIVESLRTTGDHRADAIVARLSISASASSRP
jgi:hypothetical protein